MALDFIAGCAGGCAGVLVGHPFDTIKVRLQIQDANKPIYRGTLHCATSIIRKESVYGLYKGMSSPMAGLAFVNAIAFGVYGNLRRSFSSPDSLLIHFIAGSSAGMAQSIITSPMELAKTRLQIQGEGKPTLRFLYWNKPPYIHYKNPADCLYKVFRVEGIRGVFQGLGCTIIRDSPGFGAYFTGYELLIRYCFSDEKMKVSNIGLIIAGGLAGIFSWIVTYPIDVMKSRLQIDGMKGPKEYNGLLDCIKKSYEKEGWSVFTRGLCCTIFRAFPTNAATFTVFTWVFTLLSKKK